MNIQGQAPEISAPNHSMTMPNDAKARGRPRSFDEDKALSRALGLFWKRGYEPVSVHELCAEMGISPPSLYAAFGNKAQLFLRAVAAYEARYWSPSWNRMAESADLHAGLRAFFDEAAAILTRHSDCGCPIVLGTTNISAASDEVDDALKALRDQGRQTLVARMRRGIADGQLPPDADPEALGLTLHTLLEGMSLAARDGAARAVLDRIAQTALHILPVATLPAPVPPVADDARA